MARYERRAAAAGWQRDAIVLGCDYNPEQWPESVWPEDIALMREAGVGLVAINIFGWAQLEPRPGEFDFAALDAHHGSAARGRHPGEPRHGHRIAAAVAEHAASRDPARWRWMARPAGRADARPGAPAPPSSARPRSHSWQTRRGTLRPRTRPSRMWHVSNELGCHNARCYCDVSAASFRRWLEARYGTIDALNDAWGTARVEPALRIVGRDPAAARDALSPRNPAQRARLRPLQLRRAARPLPRGGRAAARGAATRR